MRLVLDQFHVLPEPDGKVVSEDGWLEVRIGSAVVAVMSVMVPSSLWKTGKTGKTPAAPSRLESQRFNVLSVAKCRLRSRPHAD
jgi:hypothetical protein